MKKLLVICLSLLLIGCGNKIATIKKANGDSKTYLFFKKFDVSNYYVSFWDRNTSINDDSKIILARSGDKYYYEFDGYQRNIIIQKEGKRYNVYPDRKEYSLEDKDVEDFALGILPNDMDKLKKQGYKTGEEKIYGKKYIYEKFSSDIGDTTYYFKGKKLIYVKYEGIQKNVFLKFNYMKKDFSLKIFEISNDFEEISY
ncbi:MAG: hypothetical protein IKG27_02430 [Bacilli bacterium]|nr:hypothetical protein [Bacilli bacterium]